ncbi:glutaminase [Microbacterium sp. NPDC055910]|uniref:glutaminase n=1 Tax=Microbacterium sp. NPDC055910 TaxID=3345659 RepID=UPI0035D56E06
MSVAAILADARRRLADAPREGLGEQVHPRRILGIARAPRIVPRGSAWRVGVLLLSEDAVYAVGDILRAREEVRRGFTAEAQRRRAALAAAARRGGFAEGATVHIGWRMLDPVAVDTGGASGPLAIVDGVPSVKWSASGGYTPLQGYLDDRIALLLDHPLDG